MERPPPREAEVMWRDGDVPVSTRHGEAYFGDADALAEARHVFIAGNDLPARFRERREAFPDPRRRRPFQIAELGFGTGLNALAATLAWRAAGSGDTLRLTSFEAHPLPAEDMARALRPWPELAPLARELVAAWGAGERAFRLGEPGSGAVEVEVIIGDARETLPLWPGRADAWFLDGFSPARNPELWEPALLAEVAEKSAGAATLATYSAAGSVRAALEAAGFAVERVAGFGRKKHMTRAILGPRAPRRVICPPRPLE
ncbi:tRNA (5-methylaminomethyl-2-thiouridine)(34)-methyltransferase MnmD [Amaricoccus solimangrovi]|uniref:tRNA (5-methylaminomethyl-2-thiouridine)(34)-methyltransferase MnmD n=1 Tax=Amaricoccus solimangrovi TaxID=2589815 RepID=A0A501WP96_9RHOB|nr:tRNA (5-methylaminomethyl-2-thiouridine)(34)-methyltransferase MnmD [Amaricoccus solimangrovi]TPE48851.1 tRNA (5-methylaminomethyl-2-thiouridine)(34)-methyltransferase MnmD [Amaricoccus solimangrovi]